MEFQQETPSWRMATRSRIKKWFPERQVHFRTEGRVSFFRITTFAQILFVALFLSTSGWLGFTSYSYVEHDCVIGDFVTFAPGVQCNGNVTIEDHVYVGAGAMIKQGKPGKPLVVGRGAVVGMGAVVTRDVPAGATVVGNPARAMR